MDVAILGAGLSGLACAITLEKYGVHPVIFEKRRCPGDRFVNAETLFSILNRPVRDCLPWIEQEFGIALRPLSEVRTVVLHSWNAVGTVRGRLGYSNLRGRHENAFENQLAGQLESEIICDTAVAYGDIVNRFSHVVLATGDGETALRLGNYRCDFTCSLKGATVEGSFQPDTPHVWFNYEILPKGYAWLIPYSGTEANFVIAAPDYLEYAAGGIGQRWDAFFALAQKDLRQHFRVTDQFQFTGFPLGICRRAKTGDTYFIGNCFGAVSPGLGFGQFTSILTGVYAAYDICGIGRYEELAGPIAKNYEHSLVLRRYLENLDDRGFDKIIRRLNSKPLHALAGRLCSSGCSFDLLKWITPFL